MRISHPALGVPRQYVDVDGHAIRGAAITPQCLFDPLQGTHQCRRRQATVQAQQGVVIPRAVALIRWQVLYRAQQLRSSDLRQRGDRPRSEEHKSELQSLMSNSYAVF